MASPAYIPWRSEVNQSFATGQMNDRQMEKAMAAGTSGELAATYEETGRGADRAMRQQEINNQQSNVEAQQGIGKWQTAVSGAGALGSLYVGSKIAKALTPATTAETAETGTAAAYTGAAAGVAEGVTADAGVGVGVGGGATGVGVGGGAAGVGVGAEAASTAAESTSIWSTIGSYIGSAFEAIASFF